MKMKKAFGLASLGWAMMALLTIGVSANMYNYYQTGMPNAFQPDLYVSHKVQLLCHITGAIIAALAGLTQFSAKFRINHPTLHRVLGYIYIGGIAISAPAGFLMALISKGGLVTHIGFGILAVLWAFATFKALYHVIKGDIQLHHQWMIRSYALTFAFVTLRLWIGVLMVINKGQNFDEIYQTVAWLCWVPNLLIVDYFIARNNNKKILKSNIPHD